MIHSMEDPAYNLTVDQIAKRMDVSPKKVRQLIQRGGLDARQLNGQWMIRTKRTAGKDTAEQTAIILWHGTTEDSAEDICKNGFKLKSKGREYWFSVRKEFACQAAINRGEVRKKSPVVLRCEIDLTRFPYFWNPKPGIYVFKTPLPADVISEVIRFGAISGTHYALMVSPYALYIGQLRRGTVISPAVFSRHNAWRQ